MGCFGEGSGLEIGKDEVVSMGAPDPFIDVADLSLSVLLLFRNPFKPKAVRILP